MTKVFYASTLFGALGLAAASDAGLFGERAERRLLLAANNSAVPEVVDPFTASPAFDALRPRFDDVVLWNDVIAPLHPSGWTPRDADVPMLTRLVGERLGLTGDPASELVLESVAVAPARAIGTLVPDCPVTVHSDGLMSYGPTRDEVTPFLGRRMRRLLHLDLVPGLRPLLLTEYDVPAVAVPDAAVAKVLAELPAPRAASDDVTGRPVVVGQYLSALGLLDPAEEVGLYADCLRALAARGHRAAVFAPHPAAGPAHARPLLQVAAGLGLALEIAGGGLPVESWFAAHRPALVVSCFSTALFTARHWFDLPVACVGTDVVLPRLAPYQNSNRVPATLVDALVPVLAPDGTLHEPPARDVDATLRAVGYCMQATRHPGLRGDAEAYLARYGAGRYFTRRRLEALGLRRPPAHRSLAARRAAGALVRGAAALRR